MKRKIKDKKKPLPIDFHEVLLKHEILLDLGMTIDLIRKLIYLYSMAIEFYDSVSNFEFHKYYLNKLNEFMSKKTIVKYLDEMNKFYKDDSEILKYDEEKLNKEIFPESKNQLNIHVQMSNEKMDMNELKGFENMKFDEKVKMSKSKSKSKSRVSKFGANNENNLNQNTEKLQEKLVTFNTNLNKIQDNINSDIKNQSDKFEELRRKKLQIQHEKILNKIIEKTSEENDNFDLTKNETNSDDLIRKDSNAIKIELMNNDIEEYRNSNILEMEKEIEKTREIHMKEINSMDYPDSELIECMKEDMDNAINNIISHFNEKFDSEVRKIKKKFSIK